MAERILEAELDAELLRRNRLGESQAALARASFQAGTGFARPLIQPYPTSRRPSVRCPNRQRRSEGCREPKATPR